MVRLAAAAAALWLVVRLRGLWTPFGLALLMAYLLEPAVTLLERREVPRGVAIVAVYLALGLVVALVGSYAGPALYAEVQDLAASLPEQTRRIQEQAAPFLGRLRTDRLPEALQRAAAGAAERAEAFLGRFASRVAELLLGAVSQVFNLILAPVLAYYILKDRERLAAGLLQAMPAEWRPMALRIALEVDRSLAGVIRGQLLVSACVGAVVAVGLSVLGVPYALLLGLLTAVLDIIPYFGPVAAGIPIVGLALTRGPWTALWALGVLVAANQLEGAVLQPRVMSRSTGLHPLAVMAAVLAGAELAGIAGMVMAVPLAAAARGIWASLQTEGFPSPPGVAAPPAPPAPPGPGEVVGSSAQEPAAWAAGQPEIQPPGAPAGVRPGDRSA